MAGTTVTSKTFIWKRIKHPKCLTKLFHGNRPEPNRNSVAGNKAERVPFKHQSRFRCLALCVFFVSLFLDCFYLKQKQMFLLFFFKKIRRIKQAIGEYKEIDKFKEWRECHRNH